MTYDATRKAAGPDPSSAVITGLTTLGWYAVPDLVRPRWGRALAKVGVAAAGVGVGLLATAEGRAAREGLRALTAPEESAAPGAAEQPTGQPAEQSAEQPAEQHGDENGTPAPDDEPASQVDPRLAGAAVVGVLGVMTVVAVAGEKWAYRRGEKWRAKGLALPHTRVGLIVGALAAGATLLEPPRAVPTGDDGRG